MGLIVTVLKALLYANNLLPKKSKYMSTNLSRRLLTLAQLYPALQHFPEMSIVMSLLYEAEKFFSIWSKTNSPLYIKYQDRK